MFENSSLLIGIDARFLDGGLSGIGSKGLSSAPADSVILASDSMREPEIVIGSSLPVKVARTGGGFVEEARSGRFKLTGMGSIFTSSGSDS